MFDLGEANDILGLSDNKIDMDHNGDLDEELLGFLKNTEMDDASSSISNDEAMREMMNAFEEDQKQPLRAVGDCERSKQRFKMELQEIEARRQSSSTYVQE
jgi:hypothetical protein